MKPPRRRVHRLMVRALSTTLAVPRASGLMKLRLMAAPGLTAFAFVMLLRSKNFCNVITLIPQSASPDHPFSSASIDRKESRAAAGKPPAHPHNNVRGWRWPTAGSPSPIRAIRSSASSILKRWRKRARSPSKAGPSPSSPSEAPALRTEAVAGTWSPQAAPGPVPIHRRAIQEPFRLFFVQSPDVAQNWRRAWIGDRF